MTTHQCHHHPKICTLTGAALYSLIATKCSQTQALCILTLMTSALLVNKYHNYHLKMRLRETTRETNIHKIIFLKFLYHILKIPHERHSPVTTWPVNTWTISVTWLFCSFRLYHLPSDNATSTLPLNIMVSKKIGSPTSWLRAAFGRLSRIPLPKVYSSYLINSFGK